MHVLDIIALCVLGVFAVLGIRRGLILEIFRLIAVVGAWLSALLFYRSVSRFMEFIDIPPRLRTACAFVAVFAVTTGVLLFFGWLLKRLIHLTALGWADRLGGALVGLSKSAIVLWVVFLLLDAIPLRGVQRWLAHSQAYLVFRAVPLRELLPYVQRAAGPLERVADSLNGNLPARLRDFRAKVDSVKSLHP